MALTEIQLDVFRELVNIGIGRAAGALNGMLQTRIYLQVPRVKFLTPPGLREEMNTLNNEKLSIVRLRFGGSFSGSTSLVFPPDSAVKLVDIITDVTDETSDLDAIKIGTLTEVGNIVINGVMGSISNVLEQHLNYVIPIYMEGAVDMILDGEGKPDIDPAILYAQADFTAKQHHITGSIILLFEIGSLDKFIAAIDKLLASTHQ